MERYTVFLDWKNQYYLCKHAINGNLQIQCNPYQISNDIFHRSKIKQLKYVWRHRRPYMAKTILRMTTGAGGITHSHFRLYYKATIIKTMWFWHNKRHIDQWNRIKPRNKPKHLWSINLWKKYKNIQSRKDSLFNKLCWKKLDSYM